jgi:2-polyprenyl-3-methyl-5-hydroxy-6-metoxy-1,4-benzoquinol methylase
MNFFKRQEYMAEKKYKNGEYFKNNPTWHIEHSTWKAENLTYIIKKNHLKPSTICEVGCGAGEILNQLYARLPPNIRFFGYEISPQAFNLCQLREKERLRFYMKNLFEEETFFDIVLAIDVIEHVEDCFGFLTKLREKGKYKIFHIPLELSVQTVLRANPLIKARQISGHVHYFTKETSIAILTDTGYEILDCFYTGSSTDLPSESFKMMLARVPRKIMYKLNKDIAVRILGGYSFMVLAR